MSELVVHQLPGGWGLPSISPFCLKLETYLRIAAIPYRAVVDATPFAGPKGKLPWIEHEGEKIGDSGFIIEYLNGRFGVDLNERLSGDERAVALAIRRLIEENLYWTLVYDRWMVEGNWRSFRGVVFGRLPKPVGVLIAPLARRGVRRELVGHGMGVHSQDEIHAIGKKDVLALSELLGSKPFFMGDAATEIDATAYGFLANIMNVPIASPIKEEGAGRANLAGFIERIQGLYFS